MNFSKNSFNKQLMISILKMTQVVINVKNHKLSKKMIQYYYLIKIKSIQKKKIYKQNKMNKMK